MNVKIQQLTPENYYKCNNIWNMNKNPEWTKRWYDEFVSGNRLIFVYIENDEYIGEGALVFKNNDSDYTIENERIYCSRMIVKDEYRNRGIGSEIMDFLINYAQGLGYKEMSLGVDIVNVGARWLYEKKGFTNIIFMGEDKNGKYVKLLKRL